MKFFKPKAPKQKIRQAKSNNKKHPKTVESPLLDRLKIAFLIIVGALAVFLLISLVTYNPYDPSWSQASSNNSIQNMAGEVGAYSADILLSLFGLFAYLIPFLMIYGLWIIYQERQSFSERAVSLMILRWLGIIFTFAAGSALAELIFRNSEILLPQGAGGITGSLLNEYTIEYVSLVGATIIFTTMLILGLTLFSGLNWLYSIINVTKNLIKLSKHIIIKAFHILQNARQKAKSARNKATTNRQLKNDALFKETVNSIKVEETTNKVTPNLSYEELMSQSQIEKPQKKQKKARTYANLTVSNTHSSQLPPLDLLDDPDTRPVQVSDATLNNLAQLVEQKLADYGISVRVAGVYPGPVITRFELELAPGIKVSRLSTLSQDIARSLSIPRVRVVEVIPGKPYVGLEIPNQKREMVRLKELLSSDIFLKSNSPVTIGLGKDIAGESSVATLAKMPHLLVAGTTGSGKSVGINAMLLSMLYKSTPEDLRLILIDPKMLELSVYDDIPHLLTPVVTDMTEAANALRWCVKEMDRRYELMASLGVRNIAGLNEKINKKSKEGTPIKDPLWLKAHPNQEDEAPCLSKLPYIVVVADEFADMMMVVGKKVEELIARLAQKARAAGVHLILATQRPSVDVVTGLIKANIPTRIAFQVSSKIDSRTIIDQQGAEQLLGHGDMLYLPPGSGLPQRLHGAFVSDDEVHRVVQFLKEGAQPNYIETIIQTSSIDGEETDNNDSSGEKDALYDQAVQIVLETQRASISSIQRRLRIGYNRAARLIEDMEIAGIVSEMQQNGLREVLVRRPNV
ncbi:DNA translocase FtsK 4TM domain-containing protein [Thiotrichales bacterium 19S9-12]|nr:DNA translocase FtsK 4TM domain-containing protein [Thiotrichales bacterium 19S9-11]MCF6810981.1 DNA translocase FtsK 4TM domain-containing protein [Thiotrichales bacterium 19S9-12]